MEAVKIIRSRRKSIGLVLQADGSLLVRAPLGMGDRAVRQFVESKQAWITEKRAQLERAQANYGGALLSAEALAQLKVVAQKDFNARVSEWAPKVGVEVKRVGIRTQRTRWGSCSTEGNLSLNALLMLAPEAVRDYVIVHELCHRKEMNHSRRFWDEVAQILPNYKLQEAWLKENGHALLARLGK